MSRFLFVLICCFFFFIEKETLFAQSQIGHCGADELYQQTLEAYPEYATVRAQLEQYTEQWIKQHRTTNTQRSVITIPVVVHIVWKETVEDISDEQVHSQIDVLNADFNARNTDINAVPSEFEPFIANIGIEFCLATVDPQGNPTTGISRRFTTFEQVGFAFGEQQKRRIKHTNLGGDDAWDTAQYMNIWVGAGDLSVIGSATFPGQSRTDEDGLFIDYRYFGTTGAALNNQPFHLGRTCTHEVAHYFNVQHLWGTIAGGCADDDGVVDTPNQERPYINCPIHPTLSCNSPDMFMNFMNYVSDDCMHFFTEGQKWRMLATLNGPRSALLSSNGCGNGSEPIPSILGNQYTVYPNPTANILNVYVPNSNGLDYLELYTVDGKLVPGPPFLILGKLHQLDLTLVPAGIYVLHIRQFADSFYEKVIITK